MVLYSTARNGIESPLLRLPRELRDRIWEMAYRRKKVQVYGSSRMPSVRRLYYCTTDIDSNGRLTKCPTLVSKQYWHETLPVFLESSVFVFTRPIHFRQFVVANEGIIKHIRQLRIFGQLAPLDPDAVSTWHLANAACRWAEELSYSTISKFESLRGVQIDFSEHTLVGLFHPPSMTVDHCEWISTGIPQIVRSLRQHSLLQELTTVTISGVLYYDIDIKIVQAIRNLEEDIRQQLLEYTPRRVWNAGKL